MQETVVLGAGLSGLGFARTLPEARVFEAKSHPGGHAYSHQVGEVWFDEGAHISHTKDAGFRKLIHEAAPGVCRIDPSTVTNYRHGQWLTYPVQNHLHELPPQERARALTDLVTAQLRADEEPNHYEAWCLRQYGAYLTENFYREFTEKYWRLPMDALATDWLSGRLIPSVIERIIRGAVAPVAEEQTSFSQCYYPTRGGFFGFFEKLYSGCNLQYNQRAVEIDLKRRTVHFESGSKQRFETLASSIPLPELVSIVKDAPSEVRDAAALLRHTKLLCVNLVLRNPRVASCHWCYVYDRDLHPARVSFPGNLSPESVAAGRSTLQAEVFRCHDESWNVDGLTEETVEQLSRLFQFDAQRDVISVAPITVPYAYTISDHHRARATELILGWLLERSVYGMGLFGRWNYVWSDAAYRSGVETAHAVQQRLHT